MSAVSPLLVLAPAFTFPPDVCTTTIHHFTFINFALHFHQMSAQPQPSAHIHVLCITSPLSVCATTTISSHSYPLHYISTKCLHDHNHQFTFISFALHLHQMSAQPHPSVHIHILCITSPLSVCTTTPISFRFVSVRDSLRVHLEEADTLVHASSLPRCLARSCEMHNRALYQCCDFCNVSVVKPLLVFVPTSAQSERCCGRYSVVPGTAYA